MNKPVKKTADIRESFFQISPFLSRSSTAGKLTSAYIAKVAGKTQKVFLAEFGSVEGYLSALQLHFFQNRLNQVSESLKNAKTGFDSIERALTAYMDYTVKHHETFSLLLDARILYTAMDTETKSRLLNSILMLQVEISGLGCKNAAQMARLGFAMVREVVRMENEAHTKLPILRDALWTTLRGLTKH
jgi:hypothetical protein